MAVEIGLQGPPYTNTKTAKKEQMKESEKKGERATTFLSIMKKKLYPYYVLLGRINKNKVKEVFWGSFWYAKKELHQKL